MPCQVTRVNGKRRGGSGEVEPVGDGLAMAAWPSALLAWTGGTTWDMPAIERVFALDRRMMTEFQNRGRALKGNTTQRNARDDSFAQGQTGAGGLTD